MQVGAGQFRTPIAGVYDNTGTVGAASLGGGEVIAFFDLCSIP